MAKSPPKKKNIRKPKPRKAGTFGFAAVLGVIAVLGVVGIVASRGGEAGADIGPDIGDHHHAAFGINICGAWLPNTPQYESPTGIHSHADGFIHMHPYSRAGANDNATVGLFLDGADQKATDTEIEVSDDLKKANGDPCPELDGKPGTVRWSVNGQEKQGNPSRYVPEDGDVIAIAFLPEGEEIGTPPVAAAGAGPSDVAPGQLPVPSGADLDQIPPPGTEIPEGETPDSETSE